MKNNTRKKFEPQEWHRIYHQSKLSPSQHLFRRVTEEVSLSAQPHVEEKQLWLDLGSGTGELSRQLATSGAQVISIDMDPAMLRWAQQHLQVKLSVNLIAANITNIPCIKQSVHGIVAASLTGCLEDLTTLWCELSRVLVPNGHAIISFTNQQSLLIALISQWRKLKTLKDINHPCHGHFIRYKTHEIVQTASDYGLQTLSYQYFNTFADFYNWSLPPHGLARRIESSLPKSIQKYLCRNFVVVLRKQQNSSTTVKNHQ